MSNPGVQQSVVVPLTDMKFSQATTRLALFREDGTPINLTTYNGPQIAIDTDGVPYLTEG